MIEDIRCTQCELWKTSTSSIYHRSGVYGRGTGSNGILFIGEALGAQEVELGTCFCGRAGELLSRGLQEVGIVERESYITNTVRCRPLNNRTPTTDESRFCLEKHAQADQPKGFKPKLIVLLGLAALRSITGLMKLTERRGIFYSHDWYGHPTKILCTYHPAAVLRMPKLYAVFKEDLSKARDFINSIEYADLPKISREYINSEERFSYWMNWLINNPDVELACDIETTGLVLFQDTIVSISMVFKTPSGLQGIAFLTTPKPGWWHADLSLYREVLKSVFHKRKTIFQNGDFDTKMFWAIGIPVENVFDTLDAHHLIDENLPHGLKFLVTQYLPTEGGYQHKINELIGEKGAYFDAPPEVLLEYNLSDSYYTYILKELFARYLEVEETDKVYYNHAMPLRRTLTRMSYRGILVDRERVKWLSNEYRKQIKENEEQFFQACHREFNYASPQQLATVLFKDLGLPIISRTARTGAPATGKEVLKQLEGKHPSITFLLKLKHLKKMLSTYLDGDDGSGKKELRGLLQYLDINNRVHCSFLTFGTPSGRLSAKDPSLLNIPRDPDIRMNFMAPPGWKLLDFDFKQAEYVALAYFAQDPALIQAVTTGDVHDQVIRQLMGIQGEIDKEIRNQAKIVNYRKIFGGGPTDDKMKEWYNKWDKAYPYAITWMNEMKRLWKEQNFITGIYGRKRRFPPAFDAKTESYYNRLCINFPCQNAVADTTNRSLYLLDQALERIFGWSTDRVYDVPGVVLAVHDNIITEVPDEFVDDIFELKSQIMTIPLPEFGASLRVDCHIVQRWSEDQLKHPKEIEPEEEVEDE